jgi:hypothetical protein
MTTATNLKTGVEQSFDSATTALWAVCYGYCEENNLMSALFASAQGNKFLDFAKTLPVTVGKRSIACGDWAAPHVY